MFLEGLEFGLGFRSFGDEAPDLTRVWREVGENKHNSLLIMDTFQTE